MAVKKKEKANSKARAKASAQGKPQLKAVKSIEYKSATKPIKDLILNGLNVRVHPDHQIDTLAGAINKWGVPEPIIIDEKNVIIAGHGRVAAAKKIGKKNIEVRIAQGLSEPDKRLLALSLNRIPQLADWDREALPHELGSLQELGVDLESAGFYPGDIDDICGVEADPKPKQKAANDEGNFAEQFSVVVLCDSEPHQNQVFDDLKEQGYNAKKATT